MSDVMRRLDEWVAKTGNGRYCDPSARDVVTPIQACRDEVEEFVALVERLLPEPRGAALEIGLGDFGGGHVLLKLLGFRLVTTIENDQNKRMRFEDLSGTVLIYGSSHDQRIRDNAAKDAPFDLLYIDGDHLYHGARADYFDYSPLVRVGGLICIHDLLLPGPAQLVAELEQAGHELHKIVHSTHVGLAVEVKT